MFINHDLVMNMTNNFAHALEWRKWNISYEGKKLQYMNIIFKHEFIGMYTCIQNHPR